MEVLHLESQITKWDQTADFGKTTRIKEGEMQSFLLAAHDSIKKTLFMITGIIHFTKPEEDFLLDVEINTIIKMDIDGKRPTVKELYEAYVEARNDWKLQILRESMSRGFTLVKAAPPTPLSQLQLTLNEVLFKAYPLD